MFSISLVFHFRLFLCFLWFLVRWLWWPRLCFPEELISVKVVLLLRLAMDFLEWLLSSQYLPVKLVKHLHVFGGLRHLPPFRHGGEHIAVKEMIFRVSNILILNDMTVRLFYTFNACSAYPFCNLFLNIQPDIHRYLERYIVHHSDNLHYIWLKYQECVDFSTLQF